MSQHTVQQSKSSNDLISDAKVTVLGYQGYCAFFSQSVNNVILVIPENLKEPFLRNNNS